jgi:hypothetical protein
MSQVLAMASLRALLAEVYPTGQILHPDDPRVFQNVVSSDQVVARYYGPQLLRGGYLERWLCVVDVAMPTLDEAQREGDKLLAALTPDAARAPKPQLRPRVATFQESGFVRSNFQFELVTNHE